MADPNSMRSMSMLSKVWLATPRLRFLLVLGGLVGIGIASFCLPQSSKPPFRPFKPKQPAWIRALAFAGDSLIVATRDNPPGVTGWSGLRLWDAASGQQRIALGGHPGGILAVAF